MHSLACKWLGYCGAANSTDLAPIFIERPGDQASWAQFLPAAESALKCLFPGPNHFIGDDRIRNKVLFRQDWLQAKPAVHLLSVTTALSVEQSSVSWRQTATANTPASAEQSMWRCWSKMFMSSVDAIKYFGMLQTVTCCCSRVTSTLKCRLYRMAKSLMLWATADVFAEDISCWHWAVQPEVAWLL